MDELNFNIPDFDVSSIPKIETVKDIEIKEFWKSVVIASISGQIQTDFSDNSFSKTAVSIADILTEEFKQRYP